MTRRSLGALAALLVLGGLAYRALSEPPPQGESGPRADALAHAFERAVSFEAWQRTRALRFVFDGERSYVWDRDRALVRLQWSDERLLLRLRSHDGVVFHSGLRLAGNDARHLLDRGYRFFAHDSFWLNPMATLFDHGVRRELVQIAGNARLLALYGEGTAMAGDAYLWLPDASGLAAGWKMWTGAIPFGGVHATFERWQTLRTGAKVATLHRMRERWLTLSEVDGAATLAELSPGEDPFAFFR